LAGDTHTGNHSVGAGGGGDDDGICKKLQFIQMLTVT